ncbi:colicin V production protein [Clostridium thermosuccinogenes]|jgi:uncharacterized membrane protein required for colicin V production|uniref:Colicin V production protein n=1 Tax=Clostridium thermosuccinogenes TaxID=84032 RepID=A0A2K2F5D6_9CLOT|nr:CvpA family protein [Pseudoclostridium thermosuccinogenes]AUS97753.1 colicin V production protein [Pseudoclostridium thermosuccinogenes]PNT93995.1 colicin V production protein [Pseudoclostridium thermosuccinogenes]PNT98117.1 colicin V production protein [Pseudoclostridium thermosuccinogenes]PNU00088.1 colicin V production protein [Pseudoclostridium thermosuccinogenes]
MNWSDWFVIGIIGIFGITGLKKGFIFSIFRLASFFISAIAAIRYYPVISDMLMKTELFENLKKSIYHNLIIRQDMQVPASGGQVGESAAHAIVGRLQLPGFLKGTLNSRLPGMSELIDGGRILDAISGELARMVIDIMSLIILYVLVRIGLAFLKVILRGIAQLPLFRQMDKLGGLAFGSLEGLFTVYLIFAITMLFSSAPWFHGFYEAVDKSLIASYFYENNLIMNWMFPE